MHDERPDAVTMIGLHSLASRIGDGPVPELYAMLARRTRLLQDNPDVIDFPADRARPPLRSPLGLAPREKDNILLFAAGLPVALLREHGIENQDLNR